MFINEPLSIIYLIIAILIGMLIGYTFGKKKHEFKTIKTDSLDEEVFDQKKSKTRINPIFNKSSSLDFKPMVISSSKKVDNLKKIQGINSNIEKNLHNLGIYQYEQIASWSAKNIEWIENFLELPFYIKKHKWVEQAKILKTGDETDYSRQVESGDIEVD